MNIIHDKFRIGGGRRSLLFTFAIAFMIVLCSGNETKATDVQWTEWDPTTGTLTLKSGWASSSSTPTASSGNIWRCDETYPSNWQARRLAIADQVKKFIVDRSYYNFTPLSVNRFVNGFKNLEIVDGLQYMDVSKISDFNCMFQGCEKLWLIRGMDEWKLKTSVTDMNTMFGDCKSLYWVDLTAFGPYGPKANMDNLCYNCENLRNIFVSEPKTFGKNATSKNNWVKDCAKLYYSTYSSASYPFTSVGSGTEYGIFHDGVLYIFLDGHWHQCNNDFTDCWPAWTNTSGVITHKPGWYGKSIVKTVTKVVFTTPGKNKNNLKYLTPSSMEYWFAGFTNLTTIEGWDNLDVSELTKVTYTFDGCKSLPNTLAEQFLKKISTGSQLTNLSYLFNNCTGLNSILYLYDINDQYKRCYLRNSAHLDYSYMFAGCSNLTQIRFGKSMSQKPTNTTGMFAGCSNLERIMMYDRYNVLNVSNVKNSSDMFKGCTSLKGAAGTTLGYYTSSTYARIDDMDYWDTDYNNGEPYISKPGYFSVYEYNINPISVPSSCLSDFQVNLKSYRRTADDDDIKLTVDASYSSQYHQYKGYQCYGGSTQGSTGSTLTIKKGTCGDVYIVALFKTSMTNSSITVTPATDTYSGKTISLVVNNAEYNGKTLTLNTDYTISSIIPYGTIKNAGTYQITLKGKGNDYFGTKTFTVNIAPIELTVTAEATTKEYSQDDPEIKYNCSDNFVSGDENLFTGALSRTEGEEIGDYDITLGTLAHPNYIINFEKATFSINKRELTDPIIVLESDICVLDENGKAEPSVKLFDGTKEVDPSEYTVKYSHNNKEGIGTVTVESVSNGHYTIAAKSIDFSILSKDDVYKITYMAGDKVIKESYTKKDKPAAKPQIIVEGYTVTGFFSDEKCETTYDFSKNVKSYLTIFVNLEINKHNVTFVFDNNQLGNPIEYAYGSEITYPTPTVSEGYHFSGWNPQPTTMPDKDFTAEGTSVINTHTITYLINGEVDHIVECVYNSDIVIEANPVKTGYSFSGWTITGYTVLPAKMPDVDIEINGSFTPNNYVCELTYTTPEGETKSETKQVPYDTKISEILPHYVGYVFVPTTDLPETMPAQKISIKGAYELGKYTLTYLLNGQVHRAIKDLTYNTPISPLAAPAVEAGYYFSGWEGEPKTMPENDLVVRGYIKGNEHTITYMLNGEVYKTLKAEYGSKITLPTTPFKAGFTFSGWNGLPETMPDNDLTVTGSLTKNGTTPVATLPENADEAKVWSYNGTIYIETLPDTKYTITDLNGRILTTSTTKSTHDEIQLNVSGILIVTLGKHSFKVMN